MVAQGIITADVATLPYLGVIPSPSPLPAEEGDEDEDDDDEDEEEDGDDSEEDVARRRRRRGPRSTAAIAKREAAGREDTAEQGQEKSKVPKRRGRPPRVDTPMEARVKAIMKGLRSFKDQHGELRINHFERLPDKSEYPGYYDEIKHPIALDGIKVRPLHGAILLLMWWTKQALQQRKTKRKKYQFMSQVMADFNLMFENAKQYNQEESTIYRDAVFLQVITKFTPVLYNLPGNPSK